MRECNQSKFNNIFLQLGWHRPISLSG